MPERDIYIALYSLSRNCSNLSLLGKPYEGDYNSISINSVLRKARSKSIG